MGSDECKLSMLYVIMTETTHAGEAGRLKNNYFQTMIIINY